jgi:hypothetical protein
VVDPAKCSAPANSGTPGCSMLSDLKSFVEQNPDLLLDMLQFVLGMCGLIPGVGEACDAVDAAISFKRGDWVGGLLSLGATVPVVGWLASGAKGLKNADKLRTIQSIVETLAQGCRRSSFVAGTRVLLADGRSKPIEDLDKGDRVLSTEVRTGATAAKAVAATIATVGARTLVTITVDADGSAGSDTATVTATDNHPVWLPQSRTWVAAGDLRAGQWLRTAAGSWVQVEAVAKRTQRTRVYNASVAGFRTYYVLAGDTAVLVHNCGTGTVWDKIRGTQPNIPGYEIPKSFEMSLDDADIWVHPNATKHLTEYVDGQVARGLPPDRVKLNLQAHLSSLQSAVNQANKNGIRYGEMINIDGWELIISKRPEDPLPAIKHAVYKG